MAAPAFIRPRNPLSPDQIDALVVMRDGGATWREIGRVVCKQDDACKRIYARAVRDRLTRASRVSDCLMLDQAALDKAALDRSARNRVQQDKGEAMDKAA